MEALPGKGLTMSGLMKTFSVGLSKRLKIAKFNDASDSSEDEDQQVQEQLAQGNRVILKRPVWFGAPRAFPENFADDAREKGPGVHMTELTFWVGGIMYAVQGKYSDGSMTQKYGHDGGQAMTIKLGPQRARKLVMEVSSELRYCRSIVAYGANNKNLSEAVMVQDEEDEESRYRIMPLEKGDQIVGIWGHQATEVFTSGIIHTLGFYVSRKVNPKKPELTKELTADELKKQRCKIIQEEPHMRYGINNELAPKVEKFKVLKRPVLWGAPRAFKTNFAFPDDKQPMLEKIPDVVITKLTFWVGGFNFAVQAGFSDGTESPKFGHEGGEPMSINIPKYADIRQLVWEVSNDEKFCRSITLYGPDDMIISRAEKEQDEEDEDSRYHIQNFERGACMVGIYGHSVKEVFTKDLLKSFGLYMARIVDEKEPNKTAEIPEADLEKIRGKVRQDDRGIKTPF